MAAENLINSTAVQAVETSANQLLPGLTDEPAWPTLRGHLLLLAAAGADPVAELLTAAAQWDLTSAHDQAAVIDSRIHDVNQATAGGPLPWLPGIPHRLAADPDWGPYLNARSQLVAELADQVRRNTAAEPPAWAAQPHAPVPAELIADLQVWRAATQVDPDDLRPTGPPQLGHAARHLPTATRQATRRPGYQHRPAMAAATRHRSPQRHRGPIPARTRGKVDQPHPGRLRRHPPPEVGGRRRTATRRPPRRSPLVAHPRPATRNAEPATPKPQRRPSDHQQAHDVIRPAATGAPLGAATGVRPEPLTQAPDAERRRDVSAGSVAETRSDMYQGTLCSVLGTHLVPPVRSAVRVTLAEPSSDGILVQTGFIGYALCLSGRVDIQDRNGHAKVMCNSSSMSLFTFKINQWSTRTGISLGSGQPSRRQG